MSDNDITKMKVADLKKELKARGLSVMGNKNELVDRLQSALLDGGDVLEDTANSEDFLEDDELNDDLLDEDKDLTDPVAEEEHILQSPTPSETSKSISPEQEARKASPLLDDLKSSEAKLAVPTAAQRKICLKRNISITRPTIVTDLSAPVLTEEPKAQRQQHQVGTGSGTNSGSDGEPEKKVVKVGQMSALERLEMRAKKFGGQTSTVAASASDATASTGSSDGPTNNKLQARAARFGIPSSTSSTGSSTTTATGNTTGSGSDSAAPSLDALKKRAERFGGSVSTKMNKLEQEEKLAKRQARFAQSTISTASNGADKVPSAGSIDYAEKARLRLERFKSAA